MRVLLVCSSGGHLAQIMALRSWWSQCDRKFVTFDTPDAVSLLGEENAVWCHYPTTRNLWNLIRNTVLAIKVVRSYRPDVVVSTGAGVALPFFVVARLYRIPTCYIEVFDRVRSKSLTGQLCSPFSSLFLVQWPEQVQLYPKSQLIGPLL